jgi:AhpD family alkylhydroperoxidase
MTTARLAYQSAVPNVFKALVDLTASVKDAGLDIQLIDLVFQRVSQINGCSYCVDMHWRDLLAHGEDPQRLNSLITWREVDFFTPRECAALNWAEKVTNVQQGHAPDADYEMLHEHFSDAEIAALTCAIALMNMWNRLGISFRLPVVKRKVELG